MSKILTTVVLTSLIVAISVYAYAEPTLSLGSVSALQGQTMTLDFNLSGGEETYSGVNAKIILPEGVTVISVSEGELLSGDNFSVDYRTFSGAEGNGVTVIAYSGTDSFNASSGSLLTLDLLVAPDTTTDIYDITFASSNSNPLVNSKHALSNEGGTSSVSHSTSGGTISISEGPDTDTDDLPDWWELHHFGGYSQSGTDDYDGDGESNRTEFENVTDPTNAMSTFDPANAYTALHFEIYRGADQTEVGGFTPSFWGARLFCWPKAGEELFLGTLTKPAGTSGVGTVDLDISIEGDEAIYEKEDYAALDELMTDFVAGDYKVDLEVITGSAETYHLRVKIGVSNYAEDYFPDYITVENPLPNDTNVSVTPLLDFDSELWSYAEIRKAATGEEVYFHFHDTGNDPEDTHQVPTEHALQGNTAYMLRVDINEWGSTWLGSQTALQFTSINTCEGDFDDDGDVDGSDLAIFAADFGRTNCGTGDPCEGDFDEDNDVDGSDLAVFAADFGRTDCPE